MNFILSHIPEIVAALVAVDYAASLIVKITPTPKDDGVYAAVHGFLTKVATFFNVPNPKQ